MRPVRIVPRRASSPPQPSSVGGQFATASCTRVSALRAREPRSQAGESHTCASAAAAVPRRPRGFAQVRGSPHGDATQPHRLHPVLGAAIQSMPRSAAPTPRRSMSPQRTSAAAALIGPMNCAPEVASSSSNARASPASTGSKLPSATCSIQDVGEAGRAPHPSPWSTGDGLLRPRAGEIPAPEHVRADRSVEPDVVTVQVVPSRARRSSRIPIDRDLDRPAGIAAVVERLDQVHVRAADVVRGPGLAPDLERFADRHHAVGARAEQRQVTPVGVQGVTLLGPRIDLPGDRDRLLAQPGRFARSDQAASGSGRGPTAPAPARR